MLANNCTVEGESLVAFQGVAFSPFPETDWIFFYSAKGAAYFCEGLEHLGLAWPRNSKIATIGKGTAAWLIDRGIDIQFMGSGHPTETCDQFMPLAYGKTVLFPQALHSKKSIEKLAGPNLIAKPLVVYENRMRDDFALQPADVLTFTSPLNAQAYFKKYPEYTQQRIVTIGQTTSLALEGMGRKVTAEATEPNEICLAEAVLRCLA